MDDIETVLRGHAHRLQARLGRDGMLREMRARLGLDPVPPPATPTPGCRRRLRRLVAVPLRVW